MWSKLNGEECDLPATAATLFWDSGSGIWDPGSGICDLESVICWPRLVLGSLWLYDPSPMERISNPSR